MAPARCTLRERASVGGATARATARANGRANTGAVARALRAFITLHVLVGAAAAQALVSGAGAGGGSSGGGGGCGGEHLACVRMASPLLTDANLVFPDNMADVKTLCTRWLEFVRCVKDYTGRCFSPTQQEEFVRAVQSAVGLAHRLCSELRYQEEYLEYAFCIHSTIAENGPCASMYQRLVERVLGEVEEKSLCCSHRQFQDCVLDEASRVCSSTGKSVAVKAFTQELLDKTFTYIQEKCAGSEVNMHDCYPRRLDPSNRALNSSAAGTIGGVYSGGNGGGGNAGSGGSGGGGPDRPSGRGAAQQPRTDQGPPLLHHGDEEEPPPWQPGKALDAGPPTASASAPAAGDAQVPGAGAAAAGAGAGAARARSGGGARLPGHGRGMTWSPAGSQDAGVPAPTAPAAPTAVHSTWHVSSAGGTVAQQPQQPHSPNPTHTWYPWGKLNNAVDEPNQQGLAGKDIGNKSAANINNPRAMACFVFAVVNIVLYSVNKLY